MFHYYKKAITGKLGSGKTLAAVGRICDYLREGRRVATNLDLNMPALCNNDRSRKSVIRVPDKPRVQDLQAIGEGCEGYDEDRFGALVLDELGTWFNTRNWRDPERKPIIDWFLHARKKRWDVYFIVQDINQVDNQARQALCEHLVVCRRLDRIPIPGLRLLAKSLGIRILFPKIHVASVHYGDSEQGLKVDRWWYRGRDLYQAYDTMQCFTLDELVTQGQVVDMRATYTVLPAYYTTGHAYVDHVLKVLKERERGSNVVPLHRDNKPLPAYSLSKVS